MRLKFILIVFLIMGWGAAFADVPSTGKITASHLEHICDPLGQGYEQNQDNQYQCFGYIMGVFDAYILVRQIKGLQTEYCPENIYQYGPTVSKLWAISTAEEKKLSADQFVMLMLQRTDSECKSPQEKENIVANGEGTERLVYRCNGQPSPYEKSYCFNYIKGALDHFNTLAVKRNGYPIFCLKSYEDSSISEQMIKIYKSNSNDFDSRRAIVTFIQVFEKWHSCNIKQLRKK